MARPARVRMRSRKPWVFARRRLFGWNVRLLTRGLQEKVQYGRVSNIVRAAGQKELLRYGATADTVKPGTPVETTGSTAFTTHPSQ